MIMTPVSSVLEKKLEFMQTNAAGGVVRASWYSDFDTPTKKTMALSTRGAATGVKWSERQGLL
jgi:hypothetical protein